jgi:hypothetical protein
MVRRACGAYRGTAPGPPPCHRGSGKPGRAAGAHRGPGRSPAQAGPRRPHRSHRSPRAASSARSGFGRRPISRGRGYGRTSGATHPCVRQRRPDRAPRCPRAAWLRVRRGRWRSRRLCAGGARGDGSPARSIGSRHGGEAEGVTRRFRAYAHNRALSISAGRSSLHGRGEAPAPVMLTQRAGSRRPLLLTERADFAPISPSSAATLSTRCLPGWDPA